MSDGKNVAKNTAWKFAERIIAQGVTFAVSLFLARLLSPSEYGEIALVNIFITLSTVFVTFGLNTALIQNNNATEEDYSACLLLNFSLGLLLYGVLFIMAPYVAMFYGNDRLISIIRVLAISIPIGAINSIEQAFIAKNMQFKKFFWATLIGTLISAIVGVSMAYKGYGVWALVAQTLSNITIDTLILGLTMGLQLSRKMSFSRIIPMIKFGTQILSAQIINSSYSELRGLIIGKVYNKSTLSFYNKGKQLPLLIEVNFDLSIASVVFSTFSSVQDDLQKFLEIYRKAIKTATFISYPILMGLLGVADNLITLLYTEKWIECVPFMRIMCVSYLLYGVDCISIMAIRALKKGKEEMALESTHKIIMLVCIFVSIKFGIYALVATELVANILHLVLVYKPLKKALNYSLINLVNDCSKNIICSIIMLLSVLCIGGLIDNTIVCLFIQIPCGVLVYIVSAKLFKNESFELVYGLVLDRIKVLKRA